MSNSNNSNKIDVAIVGGGIAGLCLAIGLLKNNLQVTVYESAHHFGEIGAGVAFGPSAIRAMRGIDASVKEGFDRVATANGWQQLEKVWFDYNYGEGEKAGQRFGRILCDYEDHHAGVHRAKYLDELIKLIPEGVAHFGKRVVDVQNVGDKMQLKFKDGTEATHSCLIGCDGIHSEMRKYVLGAEVPAAKAVFSGKYCHRGLAPMSEAIKLLGEEKAVNSQFYMGHHSHMLTFRIEHGKIFNVVAFGSCETWDSDKWVEHSDFRDINKDFAAYGEPVKSIIGMMQDTDIWALFNHLPARTYCKGNVCIIGDAAHATTPHQGGGAGMAIEDAFVLSSLMGHVKDAGSIANCFKAFNEIRRERGNKLVATSYEAGLLWEMEHPEAGEDGEKIANNAQQRMKWIWDEDLEAEVVEGVKLMNA